MKNELSIINCQLSIINYKLSKCDEVIQKK